MTVSLVTGANRGIGRGVALQLAQQGHDVILTARDAEKARAAAEEIAAETGATVTALQLDVADTGSIDAAAERVNSAWGRLDVLVNNAGTGYDFGVSGLE